MFLRELNEVVKGSNLRRHKTTELSVAGLSSVDTKLGRDKSLDMNIDGGIDNDPLGSNSFCRNSRDDRFIALHRLGNRLYGGEICPLYDDIGGERRLRLLSGHSSDFEADVKKSLDNQRAKVSGSLNITLSVQTGMEKWLM